MSSCSVKYPTIASSTALPKVAARSESKKSDVSLTPPWYLPSHHMSAYWDWAFGLPFPTEVLEDPLTILSIASETFDAYLTGGPAWSVDPTVRPSPMTLTGPVVSMLAALLKRQATHVTSRLDQWLKALDTPMPLAWFPNKRIRRPSDDSDDTSDNIWKPLPLNEPLTVDEESWACDLGSMWSCSSYNSDCELSDDESVYVSALEESSLSDDENYYVSSVWNSEESVDSSAQSDNEWSGSSWSDISDAEQLFPYSTLSHHLF